MANEAQKPPPPKPGPVFVLIGWHPFAGIILFCICIIILLTGVRMKLRLSLMLISALLFAAGAQAQTASSNVPSDAQILHLLNRISFGPAPGDIEAVRQAGIENYIEQQLRPENIEMPV